VTLRISSKIILTGSTASLPAQYTTEAMSSSIVESRCDGVFSMPGHPNDAIDMHLVRPEKQDVLHLAGGEAIRHNEESRMKRR